MKESQIGTNEVRVMIKNLSNGKSMRGEEGELTRNLRKGFMILVE